MRSRSCRIEIKRLHRTSQARVKRTKKFQFDWSSVRRFEESPKLHPQWCGSEMIFLGSTLIYGRNTMYNHVRWGSWIKTRLVQLDSALSCGHISTTFGRICWVSANSQISSDFIETGTIRKLSIRGVQWYNYHFDRSAHSNSGVVIFRQTMFLPPPMTCQVSFAGVSVMWRKGMFTWTLTPSICSY